jgi:DNA repair ATPase RecN
VTLLDADARLEELASMLSGTPTKSSRASARELVEKANASKRG